MTTTDQLTGASLASSSPIRRATLLGVACLLALAGAGCAGTGRGTDGTGQAPGGSGGLGPAPATTTQAPAYGEPTSHPPQHSGGHPTATTTTTRPPTPSGPQIVYFRIAQQPKCPQGTTIAPIPGRPLIIEWKVSGGDEVALSVDNPGMVGSYGRYPLTASQEFTFSCGGAPGTVEKHTYTIHTVGGGAQRSKTLTASAVVYEIPTP